MKLTLNPGDRVLLELKDAGTTKLEARLTYDTQDPTAPMLMLEFKNERITNTVIDRDDVSTLFVHLKTGD